MVRTIDGIEKPLQIIFLIKLAKSAPHNIMGDCHYWNKIYSPFI
jgi:hypothetical protein